MPADHGTPNTGDEHEAGIEAAMRAFDDGAMGGFDSLRDEDWPERAMRQAIAAYLARVSPSRDGTVAVEDVAERLRDFARNLPAEASETYRQAFFDAAEVAEFGVSERTERIHDQATKEEEQ